MKIRSFLVLITIVAAGCGSALGGHAARPEHTRTDGDRYADAIWEAVDVHAEVVARAARMTYGSEAEAEAVARSIGDSYFQRILSRTLALRGLTLRGLDVYASHHPEFVEAQRTQHAARLGRLRQSLRALRVDPHLRPITPFDDAEDSGLPTHIATRKQSE